MPSRDAAPPEVLLELDFGDDELIVERFSDGMYAVRTGDGQLLVGPEDFKKVLAGFNNLIRTLNLGPATVLAPDEPPAA